MWRRIADRATHGRHVHRRIGNERSNDLLDHLGLDERLVALDVDDDLGVRNLRCDFGDTISAARVMCSSHDSFDTTFLDRISDLLTVSCHNDTVHVSCCARAFRDPADHWFSSNIDEGFSG